MCFYRPDRSPLENVRLFGLETERILDRNYAILRAAAPRQYCCRGRRVTQRWPPPVARLPPRRWRLLSRRRFVSEAPAGGLWSALARPMHQLAAGGKRHHRKPELEAFAIPESQRDAVAEGVELIVLPVASPVADAKVLDLVERHCHRNRALATRSQETATETSRGRRLFPGFERVVAKNPHRSSRGQMSLRVECVLHRRVNG
jgi:hypothetical protein